MSLFGFLFTLFETEQFKTRGHCGDFSSGLITSFVLTGVWLFFSYVSIAAIFLTFRLRVDWNSPRGQRFPRWCLLWIVGFFIGCGVGHLFDAFVFWWPPYRLFAFIYLWTSITSAVGFYGFWKIYEWSRSEISELSHDNRSKQSQIDRTEVDMELIKAELHKKLDSAILETKETMDFELMLAELKKIKEEVDNLKIAKAL